MTVILYDWLMEMEDHKAKRIVWGALFLFTCLFWALVLFGILSLASCMEEAYA